MKENFRRLEPSEMNNADVNNPPTDQQLATPTSVPASEPKPAPASSSASTAAPLTKANAIPGSFARAFVYKPLLDTSNINDEIISRETIKRQINITTKPVLATKEVQIVVPKKVETKCKEYQHYNDNKTFTGNLIDQVICNTQDYIKRIGNFF